MNRRKHPEFRSPVEAKEAYLRLHLKEPDYSRPLLQIDEEQRKRIIDLVSRLYGAEDAERWFPEIERRLQVYYAHKTPEMIADDQAFDPADRFTERDIILITYGDLIVSPGRTPLQVLSDILFQKVRFATSIHLLPFFPYSSDRGFSIKSYFAVDPTLGRWEDIEHLGSRYRLMFDGVINHVSAKSRLFQEFLNGNEEYDDFFIRFSTDQAISEDHRKLILRPRTSALLTKFDTLRGPRWVWTTFSPDQVDLNYRNIKVLLYVIDVLLYYVRRGADIIRLDAVTYLWHELGTTCAHLDQTHLTIQLFRTILDVVAPQVALITETNVPHEDNIAYFGDGSNEAQMVYNFTLPPLTLHAFYSGNCRKLSAWAAKLDHPSPTCTYFNFLDSHDGIGLLPARGILDADDIALMIAKVTDHGGMVSYRSDGDGVPTPYELNITWFSALNQRDSDETLDQKIDRFVASRSIALVLAGVPGVYLPSLIGTKNDLKGIMAGGEPRSINRRTFDADALRAKLEDRSSRASRIMLKLAVLFGIRIHSRAFHPNGPQRILDEHDHVFAVARRAPDGSQTIACFTNVTAAKQRFELRREHLESWPTAFENLITGNVRPVDGDSFTVELLPYQVKWLQPVD